MQYCRAAVHFVEDQNKRSVSLRRLADLEATQTELLDSYDALLRSHKKLRARIGMRATREKRANAVDSTTEAGRLQMKNELRAEAKAKGLL